MASLKAFVAAGLSALFIVAALAGIVQTQGNAPIKSEKPRVMQVVRRRAKDDFNAHGGLEETMAERELTREFDAAKELPAMDISTQRSEILLHPDLIARMEKDAAVRQYVSWTFEAAERNGIDGHMLANQYWQESKYDAHAHSSHDAMGIAQIMQMHQGHLKGLNTRADFFNAKKSIDAGAELMGQLSRKYRDQSLALVAYNGGGKAVNFVEKKLGYEITIGDWMHYMAQQRKLMGTGDQSAWRVQTYHYVRQINPDYWPQALKDRAEATMARLADMMPPPSQAPVRAAPVAPPVKAPLLHGFSFAPAMAG